MTSEDVNPFICRPIVTLSAARWSYLKALFDERVALFSFVCINKPSVAHMFDRHMIMIFLTEVE